MKKVLLLISVNSIKYFSQIDKFKQYLIKELNIHRDSIDLLDHDFTVSSYEMVKSKLMNKELIFCLINSECNDKFYFNLGLGTGVSQLTNSSVIFYSLDNSYHEHCDCSGFYFTHDEFCDTMFNKIIESYLSSNWGAFWFEISNFYVYKLNLALQINLILMDREAVLSKSKSNQLNHPSYYTKEALIITIVREFTSNHSNYTNHIMSLH